VVLGSNPGEGLRFWLLEHAMHLGKVSGGLESG
jgi:hypothetical protein